MCGEFTRFTLHVQEDDPLALRLETLPESSCNYTMGVSALPQDIYLQRLQEYSFRVTFQFEDIGWFLSVLSIYGDLYTLLKSWLRGLNTPFGCLIQRA